MIYGYVRLTRNPETAAKQRKTIKAFADGRGLNVEKWLEIKDAKDSLLSVEMTKGDILIIAKLFRLGRDIAQIMSLLKKLMENGVKICSAEDGLEIGGDMTAPMMAYCFGLAADVAREQRAQQTKEGLAFLKKQGMKLGRPKTGKNNAAELAGKETILDTMAGKGMSKADISRALNIKYSTILNYFRQPRKTETGNV